MSRTPVGLEPSPGHYRVRLTRRGRWLPVLIIENNGLWSCLVNGLAVAGSGEATDPLGIMFLLHFWPMHPISEGEYLVLRAELEAQGDSASPVDLRKERSLW